MPDWLSRTGVAVTRERTPLARRFIARRCGGMASRSSKRSPITSSASAPASSSEGIADGGCCPSASMSSTAWGGRPREELRQAGADRLALAAVRRQPQELDPGLARELLELAGASAGEPSSTMRSRPAWRRVSCKRLGEGTSPKVGIRAATGSRESGAPCAEFFGSKARLPGQRVDRERASVPEHDAGERVEGEVGAEHDPREGNGEDVGPGDAAKPRE